MNAAGAAALSFIAMFLLAAATAKPPSGAEREKCENPTVATPRTSCSTKNNRSLLDKWSVLQKRLSEQAAAYAPSSSHRPRILLLGDSITESYLGTSYGEPTERAVGVSDVLATFARDFSSPLIFGISADETQHLLWRLRSGGELTAAMATDSQMVASVLIGTNNLGNAQHKPDATAAGVVAVARELLSRMRGKVLINALLPRGEPPRMRKVPKMHATYKTHLPSIARINTIVNHTVLGELAKEFAGRVRMVDCSAPFLTPEAEAVKPDAYEVRLELMPDALHPNVAGQRLWAECMLAALRSWRREDKLSTALEHDGRDG